MTRSRHRQDKLAFFSLLAGTTSLIPIPFVDDWGVSFRAPGNGRGCFQLGSCADHGGTTEGAHGSGSSCQPIGVSGKDRLSVHLAADSFRCLFRSEAVQEGPDLSGDQGSDGSCFPGISRGVPVRVRCPKQPSPARLTPVAIATSSVGRGDCRDNGTPLRSRPPSSGSLEKAVRCFPG